MSIIQKAASSLSKKLFAPSESTAEKRRKAVFGTEKKSVAAAAIIVPAAVALDVGLAKGAGTKAVATSIAGVAAKNPIKTAIAAVVGGSALVSSKKLRQDVASVATTAPSQFIGLGKGAGTAYDQFRTGDTKGGFSTLGETIRENPVGSIIVGAGIAGASAAGLYYGGKALTDTITGGSSPDINIEMPKEQKIKDLPAALPATMQTNTSPPMESQLVNVSRNVAGAKRKTTSKLAKKPSSFSPTLRVNIYNQTRNAKFIKNAKYVR